MFCPQCHSMIFPKAGKFYCKKCDMEFESNGGVKITSEVKKRDIVVDGDAVEAQPITEDVTCPECGNRSAYYVVRQNRAADEPETMFYTCCKCKFKWKY